jgi:hypothetical protein
MTTTTTTTTARAPREPDLYLAAERHDDPAIRAALATCRAARAASIEAQRERDAGTLDPEEALRLENVTTVCAGALRYRDHELAALLAKGG